MKKLLPYAAAILIFTGCASTTGPQVNTKLINNKSIELLNKYGINESALIKTEGGYIFVIPDANGSAIYKLDKNYNIVWKKITPVLLEPVKYAIKNSKIYILGYDQAKNKVALLEYNQNGKLLKIHYYGKKFDIARDFAIIGNTPYIAVTQYGKNSSNIIIYSKNGDITVKTPKMEDVKFILPYKKGILIIGTIQNKNYDILIAYKTLNNKTVWAKTLDMGMDEKPEKVSITENGNIKIKIVSTDEMGAETEATFEINAKGEIIKAKKGVDFKQLPTRFRT